MSLDEITYDSGEMSFENRRHTEAIDLTRHLAAGHELLHSASADATPVCSHPEINNDFEHLRWFPYPDEG